VDAAAGQHLVLLGPGAPDDPATPGQDPQP
jgi:hypothetical protein